MSINLGYSYGNHSRYFEQNDPFGILTELGDAIYEKSSDLLVKWANKVSSFRKDFKKGVLGQIEAVISVNNLNS